MEDFQECLRYVTSALWSFYKTPEFIKSEFIIFHFPPVQILSSLKWPKMPPARPILFQLVVFFQLNSNLNLRFTNPACSLKVEQTNAFAWMIWKVLTPPLPPLTSEFNKRGPTRLLFDKCIFTLVSIISWPLWKQTFLGPDHSAWTRERIGMVLEKPFLLPIHLGRVLGAF